MRQQDDDENEASNTLAIVLLGFATGFFWPGCSEADMRDLSAKTAGRCVEYSGELYPYPASVENRIVIEQGGIFSPYTGRKFYSIKQTDIEHIVPRHLAHEAGLCKASPAVRKAFATDILNLTLSEPSVNRHQKSDKGPSEWMPPFNGCWYAGRWTAVSVKYGLKLRRADMDALRQVLAHCDSLDMIR